MLLMAEHLLKISVDVNSLDNARGQYLKEGTPLQSTAEQRNVRSMEFLIDHGADPYLRSGYDVWRDVQGIDPNWRRDDHDWEGHLDEAIERLRKYNADISYEWERKDREEGEA
ncbi:hypothetical protein DL770_007283 [Monosporascus sp. CRB-9-2]|nr:hypothetical protein DL770_007283 [Monosporascus sp. CRB-9-2]